MIKSFRHILMETYFALHKEVMKECKSLGLSSGQPKILECILENNGICQKEIAMHCEIGKATAGTILDDMEQSGLIKRERKEGDRRSLFIFLADLGKKRFELPFIAYQTYAFFMGKNTNIDALATPINKMQPLLITGIKCTKLICD